MFDNYYAKKLYPLQDKILSIVSSLETDFYLSGGTALSRFYLNHRYSDGLDFYQNDKPEFESDTQSIRESLDKIYKLQILLKEKKLFMVNIIDAEANLKLKFVKDAAAYYGTSNSHKIFRKVDNLENILANKIKTVKVRNDPKDLADIIHISRKKKINWSKIFYADTSKAAGLFPPMIAMIIAEMDISRLADLKWVGKFRLSDYEIERDKLVNEIVGLE